MALERQASILVVDDNPATLYSTSRVLRAAGFTVVEATNGYDAVTKAVPNIDLVVLDVNLPDIDGFEVCRRIRGNPTTARTPVVHLSATFVNDAHKVEGLDAGADGYITHPVEPPVLIATVKAFLRARRAEEAMQASEAKFKAIFEHALSGIALLSSEMIILEANLAFGATLGRDRSVISGKHISAFCPVGFEPLLQEMSEALDSAGAWRGSMPVLHSDGHQVDLDWHVSIHSLPGIRLAVTADITQRKEIEAERERLLASERVARAEAEHANRLKDEFLASLSHELRTPLNSIIGWSVVARQLLKDAPPTVVQAFEAIERNARVQAQLIADLLDVSRITAGKITLDRQWIDPAEAIDSALESIGGVATSRNIQIEADIDTPVDAIFWDPARFQQVLWNLVDNAVKFSPDGSTVYISLRQSDREIALAVRDTGRGISAEFLPHVFDRFRQETGGTKRWHGGLGLGLAIVKQLVESHGATIAATSPGEGLGTTFTITLPRVEHRRADAPDATMTDSSMNLRGLRVLVVEDDADARALVHRILQDADADVLAVANVDAALDRLADFDPELLISDIGMPQQDGYDLIRRVRDSGYSAKRLPAIALTAFARAEDRATALDAGYQAHLAKPLDSLRLLTTVRDLVIDKSE
jgi:PAS domain S-box-containing protein